MSGSRKRVAVILNGPSCAGKTTLGKALAELLPGQALFFDIDQFIASIPDSVRAIPFESEELNAYIDAAVKALHFASSGALQAGHNVIVAHVALKDEWVSHCLAVIGESRILTVKLSCPSEELDARELRKLTRRGMARSQLPTVHSYLEYDIDIDTTKSMGECVERILSAVEKKFLSWNETW